MFIIVVNRRVKILIPDQLHYLQKISDHSNFVQKTENKTKLSKHSKDLQYSKQFWSSSKALTFLNVGLYGVNSSRDTAWDT